jgi:hypothetical protein
LLGSILLPESAAVICSAALPALTVLHASMQGDMSYSYWASTDKPANNPELAPKVGVAGGTAALLCS